MGRPQKISLECGDILCIDEFSRRKEAKFHLPERLHDLRYGCQWDFPVPAWRGQDCADEMEYFNDLKSIAAYYGIDGATIDELWHQGFSLDELEEMLYTGEI